MTITVSVAFKAALAKSSQTFSTILLLTRTDGVVAGFTDHDQPITYDGNTYEPAMSYVRKDIASGGDMDVDNTEYEGILLSPSLTEVDLHAGLWDYADVFYALINWADVTMGVLQFPGWKLGQVTVGRDMFTAEIRGIMQAYTRNIGELTSPGCRANLGDSRCKVALGPFTVSSTLTGVSDDQITLYDTARTEPGPTGGIAITHVSNSNPCIVTVADVSSFSNGEAVTLSAIVGPDALNLNTFVTNINTGANTFTIDVDTSNTAIYPPYVSGGLVTPLGSNSGYFDFGICTITSGDNTGISKDVASYVPGQWTLQLPFPYTLLGNETYTMVAGCDKSLNTCKVRFANVANLRGEPYLPGIDQIVQVQKQP